MRRKAGESLGSPEQPLEWQRDQIDRGASARIVRNVEPVLNSMPNRRNKLNAREALSFGESGAVIAPCSVSIDCSPFLVGSVLMGLTSAVLLYQRRRSENSGMPNMVNTSTKQKFPQSCSLDKCTGLKIQKHGKQEIPSVQERVIILKCPSFMLHSSEQLLNT